MIDPRFPDFESLRSRAKLRLPRFAFDFLDTGAGRELGARRNAAAFDALDLHPRFGNNTAEIDLAAELFGRTYAMPIGIAPQRRNPDTKARRGLPPGR